MGVLENALLDGAAAAAAAADKFSAKASLTWDGMKRGATSLSLLDLHEAMQLKPATLERCGRLAEALRHSGFVDAKVKQVLRALFCTHLLDPREAEQQMERAFDVWDDQHCGVLELSTISADLSALLADELEPHERRQLVEGLGADGSGLLEYEGFREVMKAIGAEPHERRGRLAALRLYGEDVGLARTSLGPATSSKLSRHQLRVAGAVVRVLQRELYPADEAAALLPALGLPDPSESQLRAAFKVFDRAGRGEALDAEYVREKLQILVPQAASLVWGAAAAAEPPSSESFLGGGGSSSFLDRSSSFILGGSSAPLVEPIELLSFHDFIATLAQLRQALASHALAAGVHTAPDAQSGWLSNLIASVSNPAIGLSTLKPHEAMLLSPNKLGQVGQLITELEHAGVSSTGCVAVARALFLPYDPDFPREAFQVQPAPPAPPPLTPHPSHCSYSLSTTAPPFRLSAPRPQAQRLHPDVAHPPAAARALAPPASRRRGGADRERSGRRERRAWARARGHEPAALRAAADGGRRRQGWTARRQPHGVGVD